ncbi:DUF4304 domain-containing protein [Myxococcota bacterium]|nr:DUF4304 domain-containing protein [Myxococcota bacterium]
MKTDNPIKLGVEAAMKDMKFVRKSSTWHRELDETFLVVDLQMSNFGQQYYVNLGILVKGLPLVRDRLPPKENECHIRLRIEALKPGEEESLRRLLDLEDPSIGADERREQVRAVVADVAAPFLAGCGTRVGISDAFRQGRLNHALIHRVVRESLLV